MNNSEEFMLISACDAFIERRQFQDALDLLASTEVQGVVATWLRGKIGLAVAQALAEDYMFQEYPTMDLKCQYRNILNEAYNHLFNTAMGLSEASIDFREYLNHCLWRQLGQTENELARTKYWVPQQEEEENSKEEETNWTPDPDHLIDYVTELKI